MELFPFEVVVFATSTIGTDRSLVTVFFSFAPCSMDFSRLLRPLLLASAGNDAAIEGGGGGGAGPAMAV